MPIAVALAACISAGAAEAAEQGSEAEIQAISPSEAWDQQTRAALIFDPGSGNEDEDGWSEFATANPDPIGWTDHVSSDVSTHPGFWKQAGTVKTEGLIVLGAFTFAGINKLRKDHEGFHFKDEHWFSKESDYLGVDKLAHGFNTYLIAEVLHDRIHRRTGASDGDALTAAALAVGLMTFNEFSDGIEKDSGFSFQDVTMNLAGAGFSYLRNTMPGLKEKLSYKLEVKPNKEVYTFGGEKHFLQERFMFSIKGAGFKELKKSPLRYLDLQIGYYGSNFLEEDRLAGLEPQRHLFVGLGLNVGELFFGGSKSRAGRAAYTVLDYFQPPYTSVRYDSTGRFGQ